MILRPEWLFFASNVEENGHFNDHFFVAEGLVRAAFKVAFFGERERQKTHEQKRYLDIYLFLD